MKLWISVVLACAVCTAGNATAAGGSSDTGKVAVVANASADESLPIKNLRLPLERDAEGRIKTQLVAGEARVPADGEIQAKNVRLEFYKDGNVESMMVTDECRYDRKAEIAKSDTSVRIERGGIVITGTGFECNAKDQVVKILGNVNVTLDRPKKEKGKGKNNGE